MGDCFITRRGSFGGKTLLYTYTGQHQLTTNEDGSRLLYLLTSGALTMQRSYTADVFAIGAGGAGVSVGGTANGGGGYHLTESGVTIARGTAYDVIIGEGGDQTGENGGDTSAFGRTAKGGGAATPGGDAYALCTVHSTSGTAGNLYYYDSLTADAVSKGQGYHDVQLKYPLEQAQHSNGTALYAAYPSGYYRCVVDSTNSIVYSPGTDGAGGTAVDVFGVETVGGPGGTAETPRRGQGGGTVNPVGGNGLVVIRLSA